MRLLLSSQIRPKFLFLHILESVVHSYIMRSANRGNAVSDDLFELLLNILTNDKYHMIEACLIPVPKRLPIPAAMISIVVFIAFSPHLLSALKTFFSPSHFNPLLNFYLVPSTSSSLSVFLY